MSNYNLKKLKINIEYQSSQVVIDVEPYRPIRYLKEKVGKIFYPLNFEIRLIYSNKDISQYENVQVGDFFKNKNTIHIKVIRSVGHKVNDYLLGRESPQPKERAPAVICECNNEVITYFCRICEKFICKDCRLGNEHKSHTCIHVDLENLEESFKLYAISLQADIKLNLKSTRNYSKQFQANNFIDPQSRKEIISRKLDEIEQRYLEFISNFPKKDEDKVMGDFSVHSQLVNSEIEKLLEEAYYKYTKKNKKMNWDECKNLFAVLHNKEKYIEGFTSDVASYQANYKVHKKLDDMFNKLDKAIDEVLGSSSFFNFSDLALVNVNEENFGMKINPKPRNESPKKREEFKHNSSEITNSNEYIDKVNNSVSNYQLKQNPNRIFIEAVDKSSIETKQEEERKEENTVEHGERSHVNEEILEAEGNLGDQVDPVHNEEDKREEKDLSNAVEEIKEEKDLSNAVEEIKEEKSKSDLEDPVQELSEVNIDDNLNNDREDDQMSERENVPHSENEEKIENVSNIPQDKESTEQIKEQNESVVSI